MEENKKSKKGLVITIVVLVLIILGLVGYMCYDKGLIFNNKEVVKKEKKNTKEEKLKLDDGIVAKAENIIENMVANSNYGEISDSIASSVFNEKGLKFKDLNDNQKMLATLRNTSNVDIPMLCATGATIDTIEPNINEDKLISSSIFEDTNYINNFKSGKSFDLDELGLKYDNNRKLFAVGNGICGAEGPQAYDEFKITSAKKVGNELTININYSFFVPAGEGLEDLHYEIKATHDRKAKSLGDASNNKMDENHFYEVDENKCGKYQVKFKIDEDNLKLYIKSIKKINKQ